MATSTYVVASFILILVIYGPSTGVGYLTDGKLPYLHTVVSQPLAIDVPVLNEMWNLVFFYTDYVHDICSETHRNKPGKDCDKTHFITSFAPCGTLAEHCIKPSRARCMDVIMISVYELFHVNITFTSFNMSNSFSHCQLQSLQLSYRGDNQTLTREFCGMRVPWSEYIQSNNVTLLYQSMVAYKILISGLYEIIEPEEISQSKNIEVSSVYVMNNTIFPPFTGDGITKLRGIETQTFHVQGKPYHSLTLSVFHDYPDDDVILDISAFDGPGLWSEKLSKETIFRFISDQNLHNPTINTSRCTQSDHLPWVTEFEQTKGFRMMVQVRGSPLTRYCGGHTSVKLEYQSVTVEPVYLTVSSLPKELTIPNGACQVNTFYLTLCYIHIQAIGASISDIERGFVKVTLNSISVDGPNTDDCQISGLALVSVTNDTDLEPFIMKQNPVVIICRNTMIWTEDSIKVPFTNFTSHTPDVALVLYSYKIQISNLNASVTLVHSSCQGLLLDCIPIKGEVFPGYNINTLEQIAYTITDDKKTQLTEKISRLESGGRQAHGECWNYLLPKFEGPFNYREFKIHANDVYIRDATIVWCMSPPDYGYLGIPVINTSSFFNINLYHTTNCIIVQSYPILGNTRYLDSSITDCEFNLTFIDTQARFLSSHFQISITDYGKNSNFDLDYLELQESIFVQHNVFEGKTNNLEHIKYWSGSIDLKNCGYFNIYLDTTPSSQMIMPLTPPKLWTTLLPFRLPLQGSDLFQDLLHNIVISNQRELSLVVAHFEPSQYLFNTMDKVPSWVYSMPYYATTITLTLLSSSDFQEEAIITTDIIIRSTNDLYPYLYHRFTLQLNFTLSRTFTFTDYLLMEQRYIRILPHSSPASDGLVQLKINPQEALPQFNKSQLNVQGMSSSSDQDLFEDHDYIILYDLFHMSWNTASEICLNLGATLPVLTKEDTAKMLTSLLLGDTFRNDNGKRYIRTPCRQNHGPLCGAFVGLHLHNDKVTCTEVCLLNVHRQHQFTHLGLLLLGFL